MQIRGLDHVVVVEHHHDVAGEGIQIVEQRCRNSLERGGPIAAATTPNRQRWEPPSAVRRSDRTRTRRCRCRGHRAKATRLSAHRQRTTPSAGSSSRSQLEPRQASAAAVLARPDGSPVGPGQPHPGLAAARASSSPQAGAPPNPKRRSPSAHRHSSSRRTSSIEAEQFGPPAVPDSPDENASRELPGVSAGARSISAFVRGQSTWM